MEKTEFLQLIDAYLEGRASETQIRMLINYYESYQRQNAWDEAQQGSPDEALAEVWAQVEARMQTGRSVRMRKTWLRYAAAAVLLFAVAGAGYFSWVKFGHRPGAILVNQVIRDVPPGRTGAILRLSNGRTIVLDTAHNGMVAEGFIKADSSLQVDQASVDYATLTTPAGRQQQVTLADGTRVWLNAGSSLQFPTRFKGARRVVTLTGEGYFEVAKNKDKPFIVQTPAEAVEVLGTHFNINSYADEGAVTTTLLEGSVKIGSRLLTPGEQYSNGRVKKVNTDQVVSWVYGYFQFDGADIQAVMRQLSRWYAVDVRYEGEPVKETFSGEMQRNLSLSQALKLLSETGIHYTLNGKELTIQ